MEHKRANAVFTSIILTDILIEFLFGFVLYDKIDADIFVLIELFIEVVYLIPLLAVMLIRRDKSEPMTERLGFRRMKASTILLVVLYSIAVLPIGSFANSIGMLFTENEIVKDSYIFLEQPFWISFLSIAIEPPLVEELVFRGAILGGYKKAGFKRAAIIMSALLFGLFHMNLNQFVYAFAVGILFALVVEATGSIWSSMICHFLFNAESVVEMYLFDYLYPGIFEEYEFDNTGMGDTIIECAIIAVFAIIIIFILLKVMSKKEGREEELQEFFFTADKAKIRQHIATPILWVGIVISIIWIGLWELLTVLERMQT